jgi:hypothetical protein
VVQWPSGATPQVAAAGADPEEVELFLDCAFAWVATESGFGRPIVASVHPLHAENSRSAAWAARVYLPDGPPMRYLRTSFIAPLSAALGCEVLVDHRNETVFFGDLTSGSTIFSEETGVTPAQMQDLATEDAWDGRWAMVLKQDANPPTPELPTYREEPRDCPRFG